MDMEDNNPNLRAIILKLASPCNLLCSYCYEYNSGDRSWEAKPKKISDDLINILFLRIAEHLRQTSDEPITLLLHGGEPLLVGYSRLEYLLKGLRDRFCSEQLEIVIQTNGTLLTKKIVSLLKTYRVTVGISIDGNEAHNSRRVDRRGIQSWDRTLRGINLIKQDAPEIFGGILAVMNLDASASEVVRSLGAIHPPSIDLLQPFANYNSDIEDSEAERFGAWFVKAMKEWLENKELFGIKVRIFSDVFLIASGRETTSDWFGAPRPNYLVIETDGSYALLDSLKTIGLGSEKIRNYNSSLSDTTFQEALNTSNRMLEALGAFNLPSGCNLCEWKNVCKGGYLVSRYSHENMFNNPSVYCSGIKNILSFTSSLIQKKGDRNAI